MPPSRTAAGAAAPAASISAAAAASPTSSTRCSASSWAGGAAARRSPARGARPALQPGDHARGSLRRQAGDDPRADHRRLRGLQRHRRREGRAAGHLPDLPRPRQGARDRRASSPSSAPARPASGAGQVIEKPCQACQRPGPHAQGEDAAGHHPGRGRGRHPHPPGRRGRGGRARRRRRAISTSSSRSAPHRLFQRDGANIHCRVPIPMTTAALGGGDRGADHRRQPGQGARSRPAPRPASSSASRARA